MVTARTNETWHKLYLDAMNSRNPRKISRMKRDYRKSRAWRNKRKLKIQMSGYGCDVCGTSEKIEVHHLSYTHFGDERVSELQVLCSACHSDAHNRPLISKRIANDERRHA